MRKRNYRYDCVSKDDLETPFVITLGATDNIDAAIRASEIGKVHGLQLIGPRHLEEREIYI